MGTELLGSVSYVLLFLLAGIVAIVVWRLASQRDLVSQAAEAKRIEAGEAGRRLLSTEGLLKKAQEKSGEFDRARRMLHDMRGSLGPIVNLADELEDLGTQTEQPVLKEIGNAIRLQSLYAADISRFQSQPSIFDLADLVRYLCNLHSSVHPDGFKVRFADRGQKWVIKSELLLAYRLFGNLIANAKSAAHQAGGDVRVEMDGREVRIINKFVGPAPDERIYREGFTTKKDGESGVGLGSVAECAGRLKVEVRHECVDGHVVFKATLPPSMD